MVIFKKILKIKKVFNKEGKKICSKAEGILSCLEYKDGDVFIAHCLEFDLVAQGDTIEEAKTNLADLIKTHIDFSVEKDIEDKSLFKPAPQKYWEILHNFRNRVARQRLLGKRQISRQAILDNMSCTYAHI